MTTLAVFQSTLLSIENFARWIVRMGRPPVEKEKKQRQIGVALPPDIKSRLEAAANAAGHSIAEEIRRRLERTFNEDGYDAPTRRLADAVKELSTLVRLQTNHLNWHMHPGAWAVFRRAITARLARLRPKGDPIFAAGELPSARLVAQDSDDPDEMGLGLEAIEFHTPPMTPERQQKHDELRAESIRKMRARLKAQEKKS